MEGRKNTEIAQGLFCKKKLRLSRCIAKSMAEKDLGCDSRRRRTRITGHELYLWIFNARQDSAINERK
jgi:hypothetical protein